MLKVTWIDAQTSGETGWSDLQETKEEALTAPPVIVTLGFVLADCTTHISLTETLGPDECGHMTKIPKGMIIETVEIAPSIPQV